MANLLKRNSQGGIDRVCRHPDVDQGKVLAGECLGCTNRTRCNAEIFERLAQYEESGLEPDLVKEMAKRNTIVEVCPHCECEIEMVWDVDVMGYEAFCPVCGKNLLLCDECIHADDELNEGCRNCDWHENEEGKCVCFRKNGKEKRQ